VRLDRALTTAREAGKGAGVAAHLAGTGGGVLQRYSWKPLLNCEGFACSAVALQGCCMGLRGRCRERGCSVTTGEAGVGVEAAARLALECC